MIDLGVLYVEATEGLSDCRTIMQKPEWWARTSERKSEEDISSLREWNTKIIKLGWKQPTGAWREAFKGRMVQKHGLQVTKDGPSHFECNGKLPKGTHRRRHDQSRRLKMHQRVSPGFKLFLPMNLLYLRTVYRTVIYRNVKEAYKSNTYCQWLIKMYFQTTLRYTYHFSSY